LERANIAVHDLETGRKLFNSVYIY
jgi:hypothetical protein